MVLLAWLRCLRLGEEMTPLSATVAQGSLLPTAAVHVEVLIVVCRSAGRGGDNTLMRLHLP